MEQFHEGKETSFTLEVHEENNVQITSLLSPSRVTGGREERSFEEKVTVCLSWNKPSIFFITVYFFFPSSFMRSAGILLEAVIL